MIDKIERAIGKGIRFLSAGRRPDGAMEPSDKGVLSCYKAVFCADSAEG